MADEQLKLTTGQHRFMHTAGGFLHQALKSGISRGRVSPDADVRLYVDPELAGSQANVSLTLMGARRARPRYLVAISKDAVGDWNLLRHEAGHVALGHAEFGTPSGDHRDWGDFPSFAQRELHAEYASRGATRQLPYLWKDVADTCLRGVYDFGLDFKDSFDLTRQAARRLNIPYQHIKRARRYLAERGLL